jgi:hypothetical protein
LQILTVNDRIPEGRGIIYLVGQITEMNDVAHHPNRLVERTELVITTSQTNTHSKMRIAEL